ncbi:MAG: hypothetical protein ACYS17_13660 [Planctomycetota bacterium]|jgi:hypothetical protein
MNIRELHWNVKHFIDTVLGYWRGFSIRVAGSLPYIGAFVIYFGFCLLFNNKFVGAMACFVIAGFIDLILLDLSKPTITKLVRSWLGKPVDFALQAFFIVGAALWVRPVTWLDCLAFALCYTIACHLHLDEL